MIRQCEAKGRKDLANKILEQWQKVFEKYPNTRVNWAAAQSISGNSLKKNIFGGKEFVIWLTAQVELDESEVKSAEQIETVVIPEGVPPIAIPKANETPEEWKTEADETRRILDQAKAQFKDVTEFMQYLKTSVDDLERKIREYGPGGTKHTLKSGSPHAFAERVPKWEAQLEAYQEKFAQEQKEIKQAEQKFKQAANDYQSVPVTTVAFEQKTQKALNEILKFILNMKDLKEQQKRMMEFQEYLVKLEKEGEEDKITAASPIAFLMSLWDGVKGFWSSLWSWVNGLVSNVDKFSELTKLSGNPE